MRYFYDCLRMIARGAGESPLRIILTILGISFGTAALIAVLSIGQGGERRVELELSDIGIKRVWLYAGGQTHNAFTTQDYNVLEEQMGTTVFSTPIIERVVYLSYRHANAAAILIGCNEQMPKMESIEIISGRFFIKSDNDNSQDVVVIEQRLAESLFSHSDVLGRTLEINDNTCTIIGVAKKRNTSSGDGILYLPIATMQRWYATQELDYISVAVDNIDNLESAEYISRNILRSSLGEPVSTTTLKGERELVEEVMGIFQWVIGSVAVVALIVGGIGIMNVMYMSVQSRIREIGIRKAIGARDIQILLHFLTEAAFLALMGGTLGILCGVGMAYVACYYANLPFIVPLYSFAVSMGFSAFVGLVFGIAPAMRAANIPPVRAFKNE